MPATAFEGRGPTTNGAFRAWRALVACALPLLLACGSAFALSCGHEGGRPCTVFERIPSCNAGLVEAGGKCLQPTPCGGQHERACGVFERLPSCNHGLVERSGRCVEPTPCGAQGQRACLVVERIPSCDRDLAEVNGRCLKPEHCGAPNEPACTLAERATACDSNTVLRNGRCELPYTPQAGPTVTGGAGGAVGIWRAGTTPRPHPATSGGGGCPGGGAPATFSVKEACGQQPPALWVIKGLWGCTYAEAARAIPPAPGCRYIRQ